MQSPTNVRLSPLFSSYHEPPVPLSHSCPATDVEVGGNTGQVPPLCRYREDTRLRRGTFPSFWLLFKVPLKVNVPTYLPEYRVNWTRLIALQGSTRSTKTSSTTIFTNLAKMGTVPPNSDLQGATALSFLTSSQQHHAAECGANANSGSPPPPNVLRSATPDTPDTEPPPPYTETPVTSGGGQGAHQSRFAKSNSPEKAGSMTIKEILEHLGGVFPMDDAVVDGANLIPTLPNPKPY